MRASRDEKAKSRERIVAAAARLVRERGVDGASVADVMGEAGLTHGGFYKHFESKDALLAAALDAAFTEVLARLSFSAQTNSHPANGGFTDIYLSDGHVQSPGIGCPLPSLAADVGRSPTLKAPFGAGVQRMIAALAKDTDTDQESAIRNLAMMAGAVLISRASDEETSTMVLDACRASR